jgi:hypothetical protein
MLRGLADGVVGGSAPGLQGFVAAVDDPQPHAISSQAALVSRSAVAHP